MSRKPTVNIDYTSRDYEAYRELLLQKLKEKMPEYTDTSSTDAGIVILEALANGLDILSLYSDIIANDVLLPTTQDRRLALILSKCLGYTPYNQTASEYEQVFVLDGVRDEDTLIPKGTIVKTKESSDITTLYYETISDFKIPKGKLGNEQDEDGNYLYTTFIQHGTSVYNDIVGTSTGAPSQSFKLKYSGVLVDSIELYVDEGTGKELWRRVESFLDCDETSKVYVVSVDEFDVCNIEFGNGLRGKIPSVYSNGISANYRVGGGEVGNVSTNTITEIDSSIPHLESTFNAKVVVKGHNKESLESIKQNAPAMYRSQDRLVTLDDYTDLLRINFYDFLQLKTLRDEVDKKLVHIFYMLREDYIMTNTLVQNVAEFISDRCMIGTTFDLNPYVEQPVNMECTMYVDRDYNKDTLQSNVIKYLESVTFKYGELQFEDSIVKSDLENEIKNMFDGILSFRINSPSEDIISPTSPQNVLFKGTINITSVYL